MKEPAQNIVESVDSQVEVKPLEKETPSLDIVNSKPQSVQSTQTPRVIASPRAKSLAAKLGISLENRMGSGVDGMITANDVEKLSEQKEPNPDSNEIEPLSKMRFGNCFPHAEEQTGSATLLPDG